LLKTFEIMTQVKRNKIDSKLKIIRFRIVSFVVFINGSAIKAI